MSVFSKYFKAIQAERIALWGIAGHLNQTKNKSDAWREALRHALVWQEAAGLLILLGRSGDVDREVERACDVVLAHVAQVSTGRSVKRPALAELAAEVSDVMALARLSLEAWPLDGRRREHDWGQVAAFAKGLAQALVELDVVESHLFGSDVAYLVAGGVDFSGVAETRRKRVEATSDAAWAWVWNKLRVAEGQPGVFGADFLALAEGVDIRLALPVYVRSVVDRLPQPLAGLNALPMLAGLALARRRGLALRGADLDETTVGHVIACAGDVVGQTARRLEVLWSALDRIQAAGRRGLDVEKACVFMARRPVFEVAAFMRHLALTRRTAYRIVDALHKAGVLGRLERQGRWIRYVALGFLPRES